MDKKDIIELRQRLTKKKVSFTRISGCYVGSEKNVILKFNRNFLNMDDEELHKYLEIAKKVLSANVGENSLSLDFKPQEEDVGGAQRFLLGLRDSGLKDEELLDSFFKKIINNYKRDGNYIILIFHDAYDVPIKTSDNNKLDDSETVYEYILTAICPVDLSKAGLGYLPAENRIGARLRDWVLGMVETGFVFPAFSERASDIHSVMFYTRTPKQPNISFMEDTFGCIPKRTASQQKIIFEDIIENAVINDETDNEKAIETLIDIRQSLSYMAEEHRAVYNGEPLTLTADTIKSLVAEIDLDEQTAEKIEESCKKEFADEPPFAESLINEKEVSEAVKKRNENLLRKEALELKAKLNEVEEQLRLKDDIEIRIKPEKAGFVKKQVINGINCIVAPIADGEKVSVNGQPIR